ncbi:MAG: hypothetical protein NVSMB52_10780 [Chloroflexota bacterium]
MRPYTALLIALINMFYVVSPLLGQWSGATRHAHPRSDGAAHIGYAISSHMRQASGRQHRDVQVTWYPLSMRDE